MSPASILLQTPPTHKLGWTNCIGLRGFIGWALEQAEPALREVLLPLFHGDHAAPAPFRLRYAGESETCGLHHFQLICFGSQGRLLHSRLARLLVGRKGELRRGRHSVPFQVTDYQTETEFEAFFPGSRPVDNASGRAPQLPPSQRTAVFRLTAASPVFLRHGTANPFPVGSWTQLLALRFADLAEVPRKSLESLARPIPIDGRFAIESTPISFGGRPRTRQAGWFHSEAFSLHPEAFEWLQLLVRIGIGAHTAYGAGNFNLEIADSR